MFEEMTEQQAREEILKLTKEYCEKYHNNKKPYEKGDRMKKETGSRMHLVCTMRMRW